MAIALRIQGVHPSVIGSAEGDWHNYCLSVGRSGASQNPSQGGSRMKMDIQRAFAEDAGDDAIVEGITSALSAFERERCGLIRVL
jgi:hypothetical protein